MEEVVLHLDFRLFNKLSKVADSYNMDLDRFIEEHLEEEYG